MVGGFTVYIDVPQLLLEALFFTIRLVCNAIKEHEAFLCVSVVNRLLRLGDKATLVLLLYSYLVTDAINIEGKHKSRSYAWFWDEVDLAIELTDHRFTDAKSKPNSADVFLNLILESGEQLEQFVLVLLLDAFSSVWDFTVDLIGFPVILDPCGHSTLKGKLEGIRYQVDCQLHQPLVVTIHELWEVFIEFKPAVNLL